MRAAVIFGGTGFVGTAYAHSLLNQASVDKVYLVDLESIDEKKNQYRADLFRNEQKIKFIRADIRHSLDHFRPVEEVILIANFAAVHREPGHEHSEYFNTNISGAENICSWAEVNNCNNIIFTSSISPYGIASEKKTEETIPAPTTAYGSSKLAAEYIHKVWQARNPKERKLVIVRPGVVFGPGEGGNVTRLIKAVKGRYFFYAGNKNIQKAGVYIKELISAIDWVYSEMLMRRESGLVMFNMTMNPSPAMVDYVDAICDELKIGRSVLSVPYSILLITSYLITFIGKVLGADHPFSPVRVKKLILSNNISPDFLMDHGYQFKYSLSSALKDWRESCPGDW